MVGVMVESATLIDQAKGCTCYTSPRMELRDDLVIEPVREGASYQTYEWPCSRRTEVTAA